MIVRNLTLKVQGNRTCTDSPIYLYQNDRNIHLVITLNNVKYEVTRDMYVSFTIVKPNGETLDLTNGFLKDGKVHLILESELFDGGEEVGNALCQIKLYDNQRLSSISLPPFAIHVLKDNGNPIIDNDKDVLLSQDELKLLTENELALSVERKIKISELPTTTEASGYVPVVQNDKTMRYNLDGLATRQFVRENLNETLNEVTEQMDVVNQMAVSLEGKADISDLEEYATKQELENALSNLDVDVDLSAYATKGEVDTKLETKSDVHHTHGSEYASYEHTHEQYLTEHQNISHLASKTYVDDAIANVDTGGSGNVDLSGYVTTTQLTTELNKKANTNHKHTNYAQAGHHHSGSYIATTKDTTSLYYDGENDYVELYTSTTYYEPEIMESGAILYRVKLPTSGFAPTKHYEFHIIYNAYNIGTNHNIYFTESVFWEDGKLTTSISVNPYHVYEIILIRMNTTPTWIGKIIDYGKK